jgi:hypothetical protein
VSSTAGPWTLRAASWLLQWVGVFLFTFVLGEGAARLVFDVRPLTNESLVWAKHPIRGWQHAANAEDDFVKIGVTQRVRINSHGLREREIPYEKPAGVFRILVIGDSSVVGFEVPPEAVFTRVLEDELKQQGLNVEVINAGYRGYGTDQVLLFLKSEGIRYQPDLVLYKWTGNDPHDNATVHRPFRVYAKSYFDLDPEGALVLKGAPVPDYPYSANLRVGADGDIVELEVSPRTVAIMWFRDNVVSRSAFATGLLKIAMMLPSVTGSLKKMGSYDDSVDIAAPLDPDTRLYRVSLELIRDMARTAHEVGAEFRLIYVKAGWGESLRETLGQPNLGDLDRLRTRFQEGVSYYVPGDSHWNELGHRLYGETLAEALLESHLLSGAKTKPPAS